jgi:hypothetical protein
MKGFKKLQKKISEIYRRDFENREVTNLMNGGGEERRRWFTVKEGSCFSLRDGDDERRRS